MEVTKIVTKTAYTSTGDVMKEGKNYVFSFAGRSLCGTYIGFGRKNSLSFNNVLPAHKDVVFNVMPNSIDEIYEADIALRTKGERNVE